MANESEPVPQDAVITFDIPAYKDKDTNKPFHREITVPTKKAYAVFKRLTEHQPI